MCNRHTLLANTGTLTATLALVKKFRTTYVTGFIQLDRFDVRGEIRKHTLYANSVGNLTDGERGGSTLALCFDHISFEGLDTLFGSFDDLIVNGNVVARLESRMRFLGRQLFVDVRYRVHDF